MIRVIIIDSNTDDLDGRDWGPIEAIDN